MGIFKAIKKNVFDYLCVVLITLQNGWSPLMTASEHGHHEIARLLIGRGVSVNCQNKVGMTGQK